MDTVEKICCQSQPRIGTPPVTLNSDLGCSLSGIRINVKDGEAASGSTGHSRMPPPIQRFARRGLINSPRFPVTCRSVPGLFLERADQYVSRAAASLPLERETPSSSR